VGGVGGGRAGEEDVARASPLHWDVTRKLMRISLTFMCLWLSFCALDLALWLAWALIDTILPPAVFTIRLVLSRCV
jgi:hypothetical protein